MNPVENSFFEQQQQQQYQQLDQQDMLDQLQYDLLTFDNLQFLPSEFDSNGSNMAHQDISFLPQHALSTPLPTPNYCTPPIHPHTEELEVHILQSFTHFLYRYFLSLDKGTVTSK